MHKKEPQKIRSSPILPYKCTWSTDDTSSNTNASSTTTTAHDESSESSDIIANDDDEHDDCAFPETSETRVGSKSSKKIVPAFSPFDFDANEDFFGNSVVSTPTESNGDDGFFGFVE